MTYLNSFDHSTGGADLFVPGEIRRDGNVSIRHRSESRERPNFGGLLVKAVQPELASVWKGVHEPPNGEQNQLSLKWMKGKEVM